MKRRRRSGFLLGSVAVAGAIVFAPVPDLRRDRIVECEKVVLPPPVYMCDDGSREGRTSVTAHPATPDQPSVVVVNGESTSQDLEVWIPPGAHVELPVPGRPWQRIIMERGGEGAPTFSSVQLLSRR